MKTQVTLKHRAWDQKYCIVFLVVQKLWQRKMMYKPYLITIFKFLYILTGRLVKCNYITKLGEFNWGYQILIWIWDRFKKLDMILPYLSRLNHQIQSFVDISNTSITGNLRIVSALGILLLIILLPKPNLCFWCKNILS